MQETWFLSLGWEEPLEKKLATYSSVLAWEIPCTEGPGGLQPPKIFKHNVATKQQQILFPFQIGKCD